LPSHKGRQSMRLPIQATRHPTMTEAIKEACLSTLKRPIHI
jgi:hypothetical protein